MGLGIYLKRFGMLEFMFVIGVGIVLDGYIINL